MKLTTLVNHSAELLRIIKKSPQPADKIASQYFRQKKYIGSKDRRFISESVFASLRLLSLSEYCIKNKLYFDNQENKGKKSGKIDKNLTNDILLIVATCIISQEYQSITQSQIIDSPFSPIQVLPAIIKQEGFNLKQALAETISELLSISPAIAAETINQIETNFKGLHEKAAALLKDQDPEINTEAIELISARFSMPAWIIETLLDKGYSLNDVAALCESFLKSADLCLRVNLNLAPLDNIINNLSDLVNVINKSSISPAGIIIGQRIKLDTHPLYKSGIFEVQDEGSQLISYALAPNENDKVLDACAGAGGKTLHIAALQNDKGQILACDIEYNRLKEINKRASRAGLKSITVKHLKHNDINIEGSFDAVLVDAPCSGMGTSRRMPMAKWKLNPKLLKKLHDRQYEILSYYSQFVSEGGILLYATCSIMPDENEKVIEKFIKNNSDFVQDSLYSRLNNYNIEVPGLKEDDYYLTLLPSVHKTDGFFMARLKRRYLEEEQDD